MAYCANCGFEGDGKHCALCGQTYAVKRITIGALLHEVSHFFTHLEKGFGYTLKQLATRPGLMQKDYLNGKRQQYQKPFSMFFLCATITGLAIYFINKPLTSQLLSHEDEIELHFFRHYYVIMQCVMIPFYALMTWLVFYSKKWNYAEALVFLAYTLAFSFILSAITNTLNLLSLDFETYYVELPVLGLYIIWTNLNFFKGQPTWSIVLRGLLLVFVCWFSANVVAHEVIRRMQ